MFRSPSRNSLQDVMDPWFSAAEKPMSGVTLRPRAASRGSNYHDVDLQGEETDRRRSETNGELLSAIHGGANLELHDYAQDHVSHRFAQDAALTFGEPGDLGSGGSGDHGGGAEYHQQYNRGGGGSSIRSFGGASEEGGDHSNQWYLSHPGGRLRTLDDTGSSSILGIADSEGNGFDYGSYKEDGSSQHTRQGDAQSVRSQEVYPGWGYQEAHGELVEAKGQVSAGEISVVDRSVQDSSESGKGRDGDDEGGGVVMATRKKVQAREALRGISEAEKQMEQALRSNMSNRLSSVIPPTAAGAVDSLERICTIEELWECASVREENSSSLLMFGEITNSVPLLKFSTGHVKRTR